MHEIMIISITNQIIVTTFMSFLVWLLMAIALSVVMMLYVALNMGCSTPPNDNQCGTITLGCKFITHITPASRDVQS